MGGSARGWLVCLDKRDIPGSCRLEFVTLEGWKELKPVGGWRSSTINILSGSLPSGWKVISFGFVSES